jgi:hypothetical protein
MEYKPMKIYNGPELKNPYSGYRKIGEAEAVRIERESAWNECRLSILNQCVEVDESLLEVGRKAVEEVLIDLRDSRISILNRGNGLVVREKDGTESSIIRMGTESALRIGLKAISQFIQSEIKKQEATNAKNS